MTPADRFLVREQIKQDEGLRLNPYFDSVGKLSIGYGRNLSDTGISQAEAEVLLDHDFDAAEADLIHTFPVVLTLDPVRQGALINMTFNLGIGRLSMFRKLWHCIEAGDFDGAANEMLNSRWSAQVGARAQRLAIQMRVGSYVADPPV